MRLFVTGGAGFIGSNFIRYWISKYPQDSVLNFDALTYAGNLENLEDLTSNQRYEFVRGDITHEEEVGKVLTSEFDVVVHFAAESHVDRSIYEAEKFVRTNVLGTQMLLERSRKIGIKRFHHISTDEVFGSLRLSDKKKFTETTAYDPRSPYSASKAGSDHLARAYYRTYGLPITITNSSNNYGPYQFPEKFIPLVITNILEGKRVPVYGDGKNVRDWLHVIDHSEAIDLVIQKGKVGETYCVGGQTTEMDNLMLVKKICELMKVSESVIQMTSDRPGHDQKYAIDPTKIKTELGWSPNYDLEIGIKETIEWYQAHEGWWKRVKSGKYKEFYEKQYGGK